MVILDFIVDKKAIEEDRASDPEKAGVELIITHFWMPVRFCVNGVELSKFDEETIQRLAKIELEKPNIQKICSQDDEIYTRMSLLNVAIEGYAYLKNLKPGEESTYEPMEDAGKYYFKRTEDKVSIKWNYSKKKAVVDYIELLKAFENFSNKVRVFLLKEFPGLTNHPQFGAWFRGEEY